MPVDSPPVGWNDTLFMVLLTRMRARLEWLRCNIDKETKPAILVLCYLNSVLVPFRACCRKHVFARRRASQDSGRLTWPHGAHGVWLEASQD
eukprot:4426645-Prorocentrum_lima.AAC.1